MRTPFILAALSIFALRSEAQMHPGPGNENPPLQSPVDEAMTYRLTFEYGFSYLRPWKLNSQLFGKNGGFNQLTAVGLSEGDDADASYDGGNSILNYDLVWGFHKFLATEKVTSTNEVATHYKLQGWELMTSSYGLDVLPWQVVDLAGGVGAYWGNLKMFTWKDGDTTGVRKYKNPFVAPMARLELRFNFWWITIGARYSFRYDITNDIWKRKSPNLQSLPGYNYRESEYIFFIGLHVASGDE